MKNHHSTGPLAWPEVLHEDSDVGVIALDASSLYACYALIQIECDQDWNHD